MSWNDAKNVCADEGGHLAIIWNRHTRNVVRELMKEGWIGLTDQENEGEWKTSLGGKIPYKNWSWGEPNNFFNEDCAVQHENMFWNDVGCDQKNPFVCQFDTGEKICFLPETFFLSVVHRRRWIFGGRISTCGDGQKDNRKTSFSYLERS